jgi:hypothetical protein
MCLVAVYTIDREWNCLSCRLSPFSQSTRCKGLEGIDIMCNFTATFSVYEKNNDCGHISVAERM